MTYLSATTCNDKATFRKKNDYFSRSLNNKKNSFLHHTAVKNSRATPYYGSYKVINRNEKTFKIDQEEKNVEISIDQF